jgi:hypothetical protein
MIIPRQSIIYCHPQEFLLKFKDNSFAFSRLFKVLKTMLMFLSKSIGSILVSSAKSMGAEVLFRILGKSFIYSRKSRGPKMDPCGTPQGGNLSGNTPQKSIL